MRAADSAPTGGSDMQSFLDSQLGAVSGMGGMGGTSVSAETASGIARDPSAWRVYLGTKTTPRQTKVSRGGTSDNLVPLDQAAAQIYSWDDKKIKAWANLLISQGLLKPGDYNFSDLNYQMGR